MFKLGFRLKVLLAIIFTSLIATILISMVFLRQSTKVVEENYIKSLYNSMSVAINSFETNIVEAYDLAIDLSFDSNLRNKIHSYSTSGKNDKRLIYDISTYLASKCKSNSIIENIYIYLPTEKQTITSINYNAIIDVEFPENHRWITEENDKNGLAPTLIYNTLSRAPKYMMSYIKPIYDNENNLVANICINMDERRLFYSCLDTIDMNENDRYYLIDKDKRITSFRNVKDLGKNFLDVFPDVELKEDKNYFFYNNEIFISASSSMTGYNIVGIVNRNDLQSSLITQKRFIALLLVIVVVITLISAQNISDKMYGPVKNLKDAMTSVSSGDLSTRAEVYGSDDIAQLTIGFNSMVNQIEGLVGELVNEKIQKKEAELEALQHQITPHFMYNTLNSIKYAAYLQGSDGIGDNLGAFIELLQSSISKNGAFITLKDEIKMVQNYIKLQQFRYMDNFQVTYTLEEQAEQYYVPRLILQPLVENAILHGQNMQKNKNVIRIKTCMVEENLLLTVEDNGGGMTEKQIHNLLSDTNSKKSGFSGIGIANIIQRLKLYYGDKASLNYSSNGDGTTAVICLPISENSEEYCI